MPTTHHFFSLRLTLINAVCLLVLSTSLHSTTMQAFAGVGCTLVTRSGAPLCCVCRAPSQHLRPVPGGHSSRVSSCSAQWPRAALSSNAATGGYSGGSKANANNHGTRRISLISDVHIFDEAGIWSEDVTQFLGQRALGLLNLMFLRGPGTFSVRILEEAVRDMRSQQVSHLICAGDVSNLSIHTEFALAARIFRRFSPSPRDMSFVPGNHDTYNRAQRSAPLFRQHFGAYCVSDLPRKSPRNDGFPYAHIRFGGDLLIIAMNTGRPNTARGEIGRKQWQAAADMLRTQEGMSARTRAITTVLVLHHPAQNPAVRRVPWIREIGHDTKDWHSVPAFCNEFDIDLVVHGHLHVPYRGVLAGAPRTRVYESGSGTLVTQDKSRSARYTVFEIGSDGRLQGSYARVWQEELNTFETLDLPLPRLPETSSVLQEARIGARGI